jgi:DNA-directed RNA polymerase subunit omega
MARITVEDCLDKIGDDNRFSLVHLAVERVKQRRHGAPLLIPQRKNKEIVMALREIAAGEVSFDNIKELPEQLDVMEDGTEPSTEPSADESADNKTTEQAA